jgi:hypothetical protein
MKDSEEFDFANLDADKFPNLAGLETAEQICKPRMFSPEEVEHRAPKSMGGSLNEDLMGEVR